MSRRTSEERCFRRRISRSARLLVLHRKLVRQGRIIQTVGKGKGEKTHCPSKGLVMYGL